MFCSKVQNSLLLLIFRRIFFRILPSFRIGKRWLQRSNFLKKKSPEMFCKKVVLKYFTKVTGKYLFQSLFFPEVSAWNFIKKETLSQVFSCGFCEEFKNTFFIEHLPWLLLSLSITSGFPMFSVGHRKWLSVTSGFLMFSMGYRKWQ